MSLIIHYNDEKITIDPKLIYPIGPVTTHLYDPTDSMVVGAKITIEGMQGRITSRSVRPPTLEEIEADPALGFDGHIVDLIVEFDEERSDALGSEIASE